MKGRRLGLDGYALEDGQMGAVQDEAMSEIAATAGRKGQKVKYKNQYTRRFERHVDAQYSILETHASHLITTILNQVDRLPDASAADLADMLHFHSRYIATLAREVANTISAIATLSRRQLGSASAPTHVPLNDGVYASFPPPDATYDELCRSAQALLRDLAGRVTELSNETRPDALMRQLADSEPEYSRSLLYIAADAHRTETPVVEMLWEMAHAAESERTTDEAREYEAQYATRAGASAAANIKSSCMAVNYLTEMFRRRSAVDDDTGTGS